MKIYQVLKAKKKLTSELQQLWQKFSNNNSVIVGNTRSYEPIELMSKIIAKTKELIQLKVKLQVANSEIYEKIFEISELKSAISKLGSVSTQSGIVHPHSYSSVSAPVEYSAFYSQKMVDDIIAGYQEKISTLQEEIDTFNYTTEIEIDLIVPNVDTSGVTGDDLPF